ncbi:MAG: 3-methyl-2-oxobutanoate dehydrogenase subunit VorB [Deltaproteobacteria bacterium]|nr:3-methyl-2-oxobutanoate dehydrogenase subunit VorB [Deltaproteobacteria bacterium]
MAKQLMRGSHVLGEAAVRAGCRYYFGYPITPQNEVPEYMSGRLLEAGGTFLQAESELASINMVIGAAMAGARVMTTSSSPGVSLMQEGISYLAGLELPAVIANVVRGGPGLGNIAPAQSDYFQATRGGGHGDYRTIVLAPASCQELCDLTFKAFDLADKYRNPVMIMGDGMMGQMMEPVEFPEAVDLADLPPKDWTLTGAKGRPSRVILSLLLAPKVLEDHNFKLVRKYDAVMRNETDWEEYMLEDARQVVVAYGTAARIAKGAIKRVREMGLKVGLFRPKTLWPFPDKPLKELTRVVRQLLVFEMSTGQMVEDVKLAVDGQAQVHMYGRPGGVIPTPDEVAHQISHYYYQAGLVDKNQQGGRLGGAA